ncbi:MAG: energy-coupling factor transporter ATPase [Oscillospiraceae bacterium]|jgi:energy-coupling factor transport system ATP-binding protein|nr:energy-coupling factor transporter ATPase [Oscillospiraceae bacterium]MBQ2145638.1 energy-coupling factor transporter ATPase [Oscillospiraceae bacterium]
MNIIEFKNVHYLYSDYEEETIKGIDLCIEKGSFTVVLGRNGSGKSTLAKLTNAILIPTEGEVLINGISTADESKLIDIRSEVGLVFQNPDNQIVANVVEEDVAFAPENLGVPSEEIRDRVTGSLKQVGMYELRKHAPHLLSGGQKQRIAIAGVLAMQPEIIVLDEPTAMLDPQGREDVVNAVTKLCREKGFTVLMITHHMEECIGADRLIVMSDGLIAADGTPASVFSDVEKMESLGLDVPETVRILYDLKKEGFDLPLTSLSTEECAETIIRGNLNKYA